MRSIRCALATLLIGCASGGSEGAPPPGADATIDLGAEAFAPDTSATDAFVPETSAVDAVVPDAGSASGPIAESLVGADVPSPRVGMFYLVWHAPPADALRTVASKGGAQLTVEALIRGGGAPAFSEVLQKWSVEGDAMSFYYHVKPKLGFYCIYRKRPGEAGHVPDCTNIETTLATHASQLVAAGIDHVVIDATNLTGLDRASDLLQLRPIEVLFEEWAKLRGKGLKTPQIAVWHAVPKGSTQYTGFQKIYQDPAYDGLVMRDKKTNKKVFFVVDPPDAGRFPDAAIVSSIASNGGKNDVIIQKMWTIDRTDAAVDRWAFMSWCQAGGKVSTSIVGAGPCAQPHTAKSALGSAIAVAPSQQTGYASVPFGASGRLRGLTFARQWETAFAVHPDYVFVSGWNEFTAQPQPNPFGGDPYAKSMGLEGDPQGDKLFVDTFGKEFGRDIEPTEEYGSFYYDLTASCVRLFKKGAGICSTPSEACCVASKETTFRNVFVLVHAPTSDTLMTTSVDEKNTLVGSGWREVCSRYGTPTAFCLRGDDPSAPAGPFLAFGEGGAGRKPVHRCLTGSKHFYTLDAGCEGQKSEGVLFYVADEPTGETPRRARRCYRASTGDHFVAVTGACPAGTADEGTLGWVR